MYLNKSNSFNDNLSEMFKEQENAEPINKNNNNVNVNILIVNQGKLVSSFKDLFKRYKIDNQINEEYTTKAKLSNIFFVVNIDDYSQLDAFKNLILLEDQYIYFIRLNGKKRFHDIMPKLYLSLLNDNNYIVYNVKNNSSNYKTEYILKKEDDKYIIKEDYYSLYEDEYLYSDSGEFKEISKNEAMELIFSRLDEVSIHYKQQKEGMI